MDLRCELAHSSCCSSAFLRQPPPPAAFGLCAKSSNLGLPTLLLVSSAAISLYGLHLGSILFTVFGAIGFLSSGSQLFYWLRPPQSRMHWWFAHMSGMVGASIATLTAFVVVNAPRLGIASFSILPG